VYRQRMCGGGGGSTGGRLRLGLWGRERNSAGRSKGSWHAQGAQREEC
jgi:hypothetical protein